jgi:metal-responsive CopG/Arc/MetJ family transcriptional regulator
MKVAVSIPDPIFAEVERMAERLKASRSEIYSRALHEFIGHHAPDRVTDAMNAVIDAVRDEPNAFGAQAARRVFQSTKW